jgi:pyruvate/2-oxoglutarate dehydrogenase complex dihydrolipoamide dehydrogenase (E3) component
MAVNGLDEWTADAVYDVVAVGAGSGGVAVAMGLASAGLRVALIAEGLVGGECPYLACMPSKSLLRSARARREAASTTVHGATSAPVELADPAIDWAAALSRRDSVASQRDDLAEAAKIRGTGVTLIRGRGVLDGPGRVLTDAGVVHGHDVVLGTGSVPMWPPVDGLRDVPTWTSEEALSASDRPARLAVLGAGPIGCELAQVYATFGSHVTVIDTAERPVSREDPALGDAMADVLKAGGIRLRLGSTVTRAARYRAGALLQMDDGGVIEADRVLVVTGRRPAIDGLGLHSVGVSPGTDGEVVVDELCRAGDHLWAVGDVTAVAPYTHTANHQASIVIDELLGRPRHVMTPDALPRVVYTEPPLAATGLTERQARAAGHDVITAEIDLCTVSRSGAEGDGALGPKDAAGGILRLIADRETHALLGAGAVGPDADSWITEATLAVRAQVPLGILADVVRPFPTYAEAYTAAYRHLLKQVPR